ncbi:MAG: ferrous iron transport protein B [Oscillospiraceae bacterium]|jgi:ferrous iron transport protein B
MSVKIALTGNPNCGKTTMFNDLTGSSQYVGNWPGVTVEKKEGKLKGHKDVIVMDLPGIYSLSPYTLEEVVSRNYILNDKPDVILNLVDASNIERNLYLTTQLIETGVPVVIAMNMMDVVNKNGDKINTEKLSEALGCAIVETSAVKGIGSKDAAAKALSVALSGGKTPAVHRFSDEIESVLSEISDLITGQVDDSQLRWFSIKLFERDEKVLGEFKTDKETAEKIEAAVVKCESELDDDAESIITNARYEYISGLVSKYVQKKQRGMSASDKIDKVVTNRWLALPIFAAVMWLVYFVSITTVGGWATDWTNDVLFGDIIPSAVGGFLENVGAAGWLSSLILDGIIGGVGAVLGFLPQMLVLFLFLALLEDCGYMARIAFIMDRVFRKFGLSGKSFIPILIGTGCAVPGIMASRTIENEKDRKMTVIITSFIPCGAKLPIIALIAGALFSEASWVAPSAYFIGIAAIILSGIILKKTKAFVGDPAPFVMELPAYHVPSPKGVLIHMWDRGKSFIKKAGTIIFVACAAIWFLKSFNFSLEMVDAGDSMLAKIGGVIAPIFAPLGWGHWQSAVATFTGFIAKETVVGTFGVLYGFAEASEDGAEFWGMLAADFTQLAAFSFLLFNLLCAPCFAAIGAIRREMGTAKWTWIAIGYQTGLAYVVSLIVYQLGMLFTKGSFGVATAVSIILLIGMLWLIFRPTKKQTGIKNVRAIQAVR